MNHAAVTIVQHVFLAMGLVMLAGAAWVDGSGTWVLGLIGGVFAAIGGDLFASRWWSRREAERLKLEGLPVKATFQRIEVNERLKVNGENPVRIVAQWYDAENQCMRVFKSANLWFDPGDWVGTQPIVVYVDRRQPQRYHMDLPFLHQMQH
jgi:hypothetical protein